MSLRQDLAAELARLNGFLAAAPLSVTVADAGVELCVEFLAVDSMSCQVRRVQMTVPALASKTAAALQAWAQNLCQRISYLLEPLGPLELDLQNQQALIRSTKPSQLPNGAQYYEILLQTGTGGVFTLQRYRTTKGTPGRDAVDMLLTHEVLLKLADDLVASIPP